MPTPFLHLTFATELMAHPDLPKPVNERLLLATGAFLLGNTAADIQTLTHESRFSTHFYQIRGQQLQWGWALMLEQYSHLANPHLLSPSQAAFTSGYLVHLLWDEIWSRSIYTPFFMNGALWPDRETYILHHNALRVILDRKAHTELQRHRHMIDQLAGVKLGDWLPFAGEDVLRQWRDWLVEQLLDNGESHTVQVFAGRMGVTTAKFTQLINELERNQGGEIPGLASGLITTKNRALTESQHLLSQYWHIDAKRGSV